MSGTDRREPSWIDGEIDISAFGDARLGARFRTLLRRLSCSIGDPLPLACRDWANTKAAYRFFSNPSVSEDQILAGHFAATRERVSAVEGLVLVLQDTTEFCYKRRRPELIGALGVTPVGRDLHGRVELRQTCGLQMHSSLAITPEGLPLGLCAAKFWTRPKFKGANALKRKVNPTRVPIEEKESFRWLENMRQSVDLLGAPERLVHIGDRENDIYEFFCAVRDAGTHFLVRTCVDRLAGDGGHTIAAEMTEVAVQGRHRVLLGADEADVAELELRYKRVRVRPPIGKQKRYPDLDLTVIHAMEADPPEAREPIRWKLLTDLPVRTPDEAIEKIGWYASRWKIETFHKVLKSGCRAEDAKLRTAERLVNLIAVLCVVAWRVFWLTMMNRVAPKAAPTIALSRTEIAVLRMYPIVIFDALRVKIRDADSRMVKNKAVYVALDVSRDGMREVLGPWVAGNEGTKFWLSVMTALKNRGVQDILIAVVDGLKGFPDALTAAFPGTTVQTCIVHLVRHSLNFCSWPVPAQKTVRP